MYNNFFNIIMRHKKSFWKIVFYVAAAFIAVYLGIFIFQNSISVAPPGMTAAKVTLGKVSSDAQEGFFWRVPFCSHTVLVNTKQQSSEYKSDCIKTRDLQTIGLECMVIYQINSEKVPEIVKNVEPEKIDSIVLYPRIASALQETIGKNDVYLLVTQQEMVREATRYILADLLSVDGYILIKDVLFRNPKFSNAFEKAVEQKMAAGQLLEMAKIQTLKVEEEAKQLLKLASAEMEVLKQKNQILTNPLIMKYEAVKVLQKWQGDVPSTLIISGGNGALPIIPVDNRAKH